MLFPIVLCCSELCYAVLNCVMLFRIVLCCYSFCNYSGNSPTFLSNFCGDTRYLCSQGKQVKYCNQYIQSTTPFLSCSLYGKENREAKPNKLLSCTTGSPSQAACKASLQDQKRFFLAINVIDKFKITLWSLGIQKNTNIIKKCSKKSRTIILTILLLISSFLTFSV